MILRRFKLQPFLATAAVACAFTGCSNLPTSGPSQEEIQKAAAQPGGGGIQVIDVDDRVARTLLAARRFSLFSETLGDAPATGNRVGHGDMLEISLWEAPPATLFGGGGVVDPRSQQDFKSPGRGSGSKK